METGSSRRASKSSSSVFFRISQLCKLRSVGVFSSTESRKPTHTEPLEETFEEFVLSKLFSSISALKCAYVELQQAHIPYEPGKIKAVDEVLVSQLESLSELEHLYVEKQKGKFLEFEKHEVVSQELQALIQAKDAEILGLKWEIEELDCRNAEMMKLVENGVCCVYKELTPSVFSDVFDLAYKSVRVFAKLVISLMKVSGWDLSLAANSIVGSVAYSEKSHKKYAFEAYIFRKMLSGEEVEWLELDHLNRIMSFGDAFDALMQDPDSSYAKFCRLKYLQFVQPKMEFAFFSNLHQRMFVSNGGHPSTPFYRGFARMARLVWCLRVMACSFIPNAEMFYANKGDEYSEDYMETL
ncbi:putative protein gravitropic in the light 1 [Dioscorea sansibarensis]